MRLHQLVLLVAIIIVLAGCSLMKPKPGFREDEFALPVEQPFDKGAAPGSLWDPNDRFIYMYADPRARRVGDIVVVQIVENSSADKQAKTKSDKSDSTDDSISSLLGLPLDKSSIFGNKISPTVSASTETKFKADGQTSRKGTISAVVSARVERLLPSGNMVIKGKKQIRVNSELQYIVVSGIIRPEDIGPLNTIQSNYIADMQLDYYGTGILGDQQGKGFIARALDKIWPF